MNQSLSILILMTVSRPVCNVLFMVGSAPAPTTSLIAHRLQMFQLYSGPTLHTRNCRRLVFEPIRTTLLSLMRPPTSPQLPDRLLSHVS